MCIYNDIYDINRNRFIFNLSICDYYYWDHNKKILYANIINLQQKPFQEHEPYTQFSVQNDKATVKPISYINTQINMIRIVKIMSRIHMIMLFMMMV